jgi:HPt (histidine-containing phosphotransfer) domain-containing protein
MVATMVDHELNELKREFLGEARAKVSEMQSAVAGADDSETRNRLAYLAHQLKGSGGSYGYQRISDEAAELEKGVESFIAGEGAKTPADLERLVARLHEEIERAARELA